MFFNLLSLNIFFLVFYNFLACYSFLNDVTFTIAYNTALSQFVGTLAYDGHTAKIDLGETFSVNAITDTFDGDSSFVGHVNDIQLKVTTVPEPTTATLSLLALAGLATRRRRSSL